MKSFKMNKHIVRNRPLSTISPGELRNVRGGTLILEDATSGIKVPQTPSGIRVAGLSGIKVPEASGIKLAD